MNNEIVLVNKDGFMFSFVNKNHYRVKFDIENEHIFMAKIIDFPMIQLIYDLNGDIYEKVNVEYLNENEIIATIIIKHFFEDLGMPQKFSFIHMKKTIEQDRILFTGQSISSHLPEGMPIGSELMKIQDLNCNCKLITPHSIDFNVDIIFDKSMLVPKFAEKMIGIILLKIFKRVKQFIENIRM